jgi:hypothetical protein
LQKRHLKEQNKSSNSVRKTAFQSEATTAETLTEAATAKAITEVKKQPQQLK